MNQRSSLTILKIDLSVLLLGKEGEFRTEMVDMISLGLSPLDSLTVLNLFLAFTWLISVCLNTITLISGV